MVVISGSLVWSLQIPFVKLGNVNNSLEQVSPYDANVHPAVYDPVCRDALDLEFNAMWSAPLICQSHHPYFITISTVIRVELLSKRLKFCFVLVNTKDY